MKVRIGNVGMGPVTLLVVGPFILMLWLVFLPFKLLAKWQDRRRLAEANDRTRRQQAELIGREVERWRQIGLGYGSTPVAIPPRRDAFELELPPPPNR